MKRHFETHHKAIKPWATLAEPERSGNYVTAPKLKL
jgi:hypothetical protein